MSGDRLAKLEEFLRARDRPHYCCSSATCNHKSDVESDSDNDSDPDSEIHKLDTLLHNEVKAARATCSQCSDLFERLLKRVRKSEGPWDKDNSDFGLKRQSYYIDVRNHDSQCTCRQKDCKRRLNFGSIIDAREGLWGKGKASAPTRKVRNDKISDLLRDAHATYIATLATTGRAAPPMQQFIFMIGNSVVCERAFFYLLFIPGSKRKLTRIKREVLIASGLKLEPTHSEAADSEALPHKDCPKFIHACGHIQKAARMCAGGTSAFEGHDKTIYIPYPDIHYFYYEYEAFCTSNKIERSSRAGLTTFGLAWKKMSDELCLSLSGGRGGHDTCAVCANAKELLRESDDCGWSPEERDIIMEFRRQHIYQQMQERIYLEANIQETYALDPLGRPIAALVLIDAMSKDRGNSPFNGLSNKKSDTDVITSRLFGAEVHCGPVHGTFFYYTDDMMSGGGNLVAQIMREGIHALHVIDNCLIFIICSTA
jgi:hypothetical protein